MPLTLYEEYTRKEVHDIFDPDSSFSPQRGTWGLHGIVCIPNRSGDFVFFVTFGSRQGNHTFDEGITEDGVLTWQSQPRHRLDSKLIRKLIQHNDLTNNIYLFLRTRKGIPYTYLGRLRYLTHDRERENPVWFKWQILNWDPSKVPYERMGLTFLPPYASDRSHSRARTSALVKTAPPSIRRRRGGLPTRSFRAYAVVDRAEQDARNRKLGCAGETLVLEAERQSLRAHGRDDLATQVRHIAAIEGDGAGYDILSWFPDGRRKYIEVKTTEGGADTPFFVTANEVAFSAKHAPEYYLYRVYNYNSDTKSGNYFVLEGDLRDALDLEPTSYRACLREEGIYRRKEKT